MARGYIKFGESRPCMCRCSYSGPKAKFLCEDCLHVCKAPHDGHPLCPAGHGPMRYMGDKWRPAKKGKRTVPPDQNRNPWSMSDGELLLEKLEKQVADLAGRRVG